MTLIGNELKRALRAGERVYGTCVLSTSPHWPAMVAGIGLDFVFIDTEHVAIDRTQLAWMCQAYRAHGLAPIVRIPSPDPYLACQVIDGGATGVVAPYVERVDEVQRLRGAVKFRPLKGNRLERVLTGEDQLDRGVRDYLAEATSGSICIVNIESTPALEALDDIVAVPDLDALLIGPHDLSISLGIPEQYSHRRFQHAVRTIIEKGRAAGIGVGIHYSDGISATIGWAKDGLNLIIHSSDLSLVRDALTADLNRFRAELGDEARTHNGPIDSTKSVDV